MELEDIHETTELHLTGEASDKKIDMKKQQEKFDLMRKNMEDEIPSKTRSVNATNIEARIS